MFLLFGDSVSAADWGNVSGQESKFAQAFNTAQEYLSHRGRLGPFYWLLNTPGFRKACRTCHQFIDEAIAKSLEKSHQFKTDGSQRNDAGDSKGQNLSFVESLISRTSDPQVLRDQCLNVLLTGRDTTGCCLQWTL